LKVNATSFFITAFQQMEFVFQLMTDDLFLILLDTNSDILFAMNEKLEAL
tara:strand:- start:710 stop:859 length:150 start_codon:yes stop_codon:yes gene_type:complete